MFIQGISIIILVCQKSESVGPVQQNIKSPSPNSAIWHHHETKSGRK